MFSNDHESNWKRWGSHDPYFGVLVDKNHRKSKLNEEFLESFFKTGENDIEYILSKLPEEFSASIGDGTALDFGSGVGRLAIPLAKRFSRVIGVDVSPGMNQEALKNASKYGVNLELFENLSNLPKGLEYDFIHSLIVLQHIPQEVGENLILKMLSLLKKGGYAAFQVPISNKHSKLWNLQFKLRMKISWLNIFVNLLKRRSIFEPFMQMNCYDLNRLIKVLQLNEYVDVRLIKKDSDVWYEGVYLVVRK